MAGVQQVPVRLAYTPSLVEITGLTSQVQALNSSSPSWILQTKAHPCVFLHLFPRFPLWGSEQPATELVRSVGETSTLLLD